MILQRLTNAFRKQDWFTVLIETLIVVLGVFLGLQVNNWNEARAAKARKAEIIAALITDLQDSMLVHEKDQFQTIDRGLTAWDAARAAGEHPVPFYFRIEGSDTAPDTWAVLQQMDIAGLIDPQMIFDLNFYYSELEGVGRKYVRYVIFVENQILPYETGDPMYFYTADGTALKPEFEASMRRLREFKGEIQRLTAWAGCLKERLETGAKYKQACLRGEDAIREKSRPAQPFLSEESK